MRPDSRLVVRALAGDHDIDAVIAENALELDDVGEPRHVFQDQRVRRSAGWRSSSGSVAFLAPEIGIAPLRR